MPIDLAHTIHSQYRHARHLAALTEQTHLEWARDGHHLGP